MAQIKSIFGSYADKLQFFVDTNLDKFAAPWFPKYFGWAPAQQSLTFVTAIGRSRIEAAASVIARGSLAPLRGRMPLEKYSGEIPPISQKFKMDERDVREFWTLQNAAVSDEAKKNQLLQYMFGDVKKCGDAAMHRLDAMILEGLSTGQITLTTTNNPDGVVAPTAVDLFMPSGNKQNAAVDWGTSATATPFTDIVNMVNTAYGNGVSFAKILMSRTLFLKFIKTTEVKNMLSNFLGFKTAGNVIPTLDNANLLLEASQLPTIEIVDVPIGIEKNGVITSIRPFSDTNAVFIPSGSLGEIKNSIAVEQQIPVDKVAYANYNQALISKWSDNEPFQELTKVELNAFPSIDGIGSIYLLSSTLAY